MFFLFKEIPACQTFSKAEIKNAFKDIQVNILFI